MLSWTPALALGISELDGQHQELFRRADAFVAALETSSPADVERLLGFLREHVAAHFGAEEGWMRDAGYPDLEAHHAEHARFAGELASLTARGALAARPGDVAAWLIRWLHDHVVRTDTAAARWVLARRAPGGR